MVTSTRSKAKTKGVVEDTAHSKSKAKAQFKAQFKAKSKSTTKTKTKPKSKSKSKPKPKPKARTKPKGPKVTPEDFQAVAASAKLANDKADMNSISISNHSKMLKFLYINQRRTQAVDLAIVVFLLVVFRSAIADNSAFLLDIVKRFWE
mmetsp:Transcript_4096/g.9651  ORF Transcript_4096/g.9651 Transcript_4096/m.9651 type:complete len:149 (-) Transcript_4096:146-592(-)